MHTTNSEIWKRQCTGMGCISCDSVGSITDAEGRMKGECMHHIDVTILSTAIFSVYILSYPS